MVASVRMPVEVPHIVAAEFYIDVMTSGAQLSAWWSLDGCRFSALAASPDFVTNPTSCADTWAGLGQGGAGVDPNHYYPNHLTIKGVAAIPGETTLAPGTEYSLMRVRISRAKSTGTGSCAGCNDAACLVLHGVVLVTVGGVDAWSVCQMATRNYVTYNGGAIAYGASCPEGVYDTFRLDCGIGGCHSRCSSLPVPALNRTWGQIKALYR